MNSRPGCYLCFKTLDPQDEDYQLRTSVQCSRCGTMYHESCWNQGKKCLKCSNTQAAVIENISVDPLQVETKTRTLPIEPSDVIHLNGQQTTREKLKQAYSSIDKTSRYIIRWLSITLLGLFLLIIASLVGAYTHRVLYLNYLTAETVMDAIFKDAPPSFEVLVSSFMSGIIFALVFYSRPRSAPETDTNFRRLTCTLAGVITLVGLDMFLLDLTFNDLLNLNFDFQRHEELLYAQGVTAFVVFLLIPLHRRLTSTNLALQIGLPDRLRGVYGWARFFIVTLLIGAFIAYLSTKGPSTSENYPIFYASSFGSLDIILTLPIVSAFVAAMAVASITYWPPKFRQISGHGVLRLFVVVACIMTVGYLYRLTDNTETFINIVTGAAIAMFIAIPVQRSLS